LTFLTPVNTGREHGRHFRHPCLRPVNTGSVDRCLNTARDACPRWKKHCRAMLFATRLLRPHSTSRTSWKLVGNPSCQLVGKLQLSAAIGL